MTHTTLMRARLYSLLAATTALVLMLPRKAARAETPTSQHVASFTYADDNLLALAASKFPGVGSAGDEEKQAFDTFFKNTQEGKKADFSYGLQDDYTPWLLVNPVFTVLKQKVLDPIFLGEWGKARTIQAKWLEWLCTEPKAVTKIRSRGINIVGAKIEGQVDLSYVNLPFPLRAYHCVFTDDIRLEGAKVGSLQLPGTWIKGLSAVGLTVDKDVSFVHGFQAIGPASLQNATINGPLNCEGGRFSNAASSDPALNLRGARIGSVLLGNGFVANGEVRMRDAAISGTLNGDGGRFIGSKWAALDLEGARTGFVLLQNSFALGQVWLYRATIDGNLECDHAVFINPSGYALNLDYAKAGTAILRDLFAVGTVSLLNATLDGSLECDDAELAGPKFDDAKFIQLDKAKIAVNAQESSIKGSVRLVNAFVDGRVALGGAHIDHELRLERIRWGTAHLDLSFAKAKALVNAKDSWPTRGTLDLDGFTFDELRPESDLDTIKDPDANTEKDWIKRQGGRFHSQPYEQMASVFRNMGLQEEAVKILINKSRAAGPVARWQDAGESRKYWAGVCTGKVSDLPKAVGALLKALWDLCWYYFFGRLIGYGYHPWYAFSVSLVIIGLGAYLFKAGHDAGIVIPADDGASRRRLCENYPKFSALIYSLETFVPLVKLGVGDHWRPNALDRTQLRLGRILPFKIPKCNAATLLRSYFCFHVIAGWVLTTLWVGAFTGLIKS